MTFRRIAFSLAAVVAMCGSASAKPPEARELDPVARDFFAGPPAASDESSPPRATERQADSADGSFLASLRDTVMPRLTIPLGTVQPAGGAR